LALLPTTCSSRALCGSCRVDGAPCRPMLLGVVVVADGFKAERAVSAPFSSSPKVSLAPAPDPSCVVSLLVAALLQNPGSLLVWSAELASSKR